MTQDVAGGTGSASSCRDRIDRVCSTGLRIREQDPQVTYKNTQVISKKRNHIAFRLCPIDAGLVIENPRINVLPFHFALWVACPETIASKLYCGADKRVTTIDWIPLFERLISDEVPNSAVMYSRTHIHITVAFVKV